MDMGTLYNRVYRIKLKTTLQFTILYDLTNKSNKSNYSEGTIFKII